MKKIGLLVSAALLVAGVAFGQSAPKNDIYGNIQFDYDASGMRLDSNAPTGDPLSQAYLGNFTFDRFLRLGFITQPTNDLRMHFEFDFRNFELRLAYFNWMPMKGLSITGGRMFKDFSPVDPYIYANRFQAVGVSYTSGPLTLAAQLGNETDILAGAGGNGPTFFPSVLGSSAIYAAWQTDPGIKLDPAISYKVLDRKDATLSVGVNAEITLNTLNAGSTLPTGFNVKDGTSLSANILANVSGWNVQLEGTYQDIAQDASMNAQYQKLTAYGLIGYKMANFFPNFYVIGDGLNWNASTPGSPKPNVTLNLELPVTVTPGLTIDPMGSYAISGYNWWDEGSSPTSNVVGGKALLPQNDWMIALRFDYQFNSRF